MSLRKAVVMAVVLLALGAYVYLVELPRDEENAAKKKLFTFAKDTVSEVHLTYPERSLHLKKDAAGKWRVVQPIDTEADETTVTNLVNAIADAEISRILDEPVQDPALYGLNAPAVKLQVTLKDGKSLPQVLIGKDTPVGFSVYLQKEGETKLLLTPQAFRLGLTKEVKDIRDKTIFSLQPGEVKKIEIKGQGKDISLTKIEAGWSLERPTNGKADDAQVQTFLTAVQNLKAVDFVEQPVLEAKEYGLAPPQLTLSFSRGAESAKKTLLVGGEKTVDSANKQRYLKREEQTTLFLAADWVFRDLDKSVNDFRDKTIARFAQGQAVKITVKRRDQQDFTLTRGADKKWTIDKTGDGVFQETVATQLLSALADLRGYEVAADNPPDLAVYDLATPAVAIIVSDEKNAQLASVHAGQKNEGDAKKMFAMSAGGSAVFALRDYMFERLDKTPADFWGKLVEPSPGKSAAPPSGPPEEETLSDEEAE